MKGKKDKHLILEFTEFNAQRLNPDSARMGISVDNPQLSVNAFDKHEDAIRAGISKINNILNSLSNSSTYRSLKSKLALEKQKIQSMKVQRIIKSNEVNYDVYIAFVIDEEEYYGVIKDILDDKPQVISEVFKDSELIQSKEWVIRTSGLLIKAVKTWLKPEKGLYKFLNEELLCYSEKTGDMLKITKGETIQVIGSNNIKIKIDFKGEICNLVNDNYIYFNWWFEKVNK